MDLKSEEVHDHVETLRNGMRHDEDNISISAGARGDNLPEGYFMSLQFIAVVLGFALTAISAFMFLLMPYSILSSINADIGWYNPISCLVGTAELTYMTLTGPSPYISWVSISRTLALSFSYTIVGRLSDLYGRRWFHIGGNIVSLVGIIMCAVAQNVGTLIGGCTVYGLGEVVQLTFTVALGELVPNKHRPTISSFIFLTNAPFATFGPVIANKFLTVGLGWRWVFYINIIACGLGTILLFFFYHPPKFEQLHERHTKRQLLKELDYMGMFLFVAGLTLFLLGVSLGGGLYPWDSAAPIATLVVGFCLLVALGVYEAKANLHYPVLPVKFFRNRGFFSLVVCITICTTFYNPFTIIWPQEIANVYSHDHNTIGWVSCTIGGGCALGQAVGFAVVKWGRNVRYWIMGCMVVMVATECAMGAMTPDSLDMGIAFTVVGPVALGIVELVALTIAPFFCNPADIGLATGLLLSVRSIGGSVSVAVYTTILRNRLSSTVPRIVGPVAAQAGLSAEQVSAVCASIAAGSFARFPGLTPEATRAISQVIPVAWLQAVKTVYLAAIGFGAVGLAASLLTKDVRKHLTNKVERRMNMKTGTGKKDMAEEAAEKA